MIVLGIESTCDETACAVVRDGSEILSNVISSQIDLHREFGGVVPELACRRHVDVFIPILDEALKQANVSLEEVDVIAVANTPGLIGALLIGVNAAKALALAMQKPLVGINHIEAHLYAALMSHQEAVSFPCLGVVLSGGHTALVHMKDIGNYELISHTVDDAVGEAFDKVAKMMGFPYPGGPKIEKLAKSGNSKRFALKAGQVKGKPLHFSFSGLKTGALYAMKAEANFSAQDQHDLAASFQQAALSDIVKKTLDAAQLYGCQTIIFGGGVTNNKALRGLFQDAVQGERQLFWPSHGLSLDNAAMIAGLGYHVFKQKGADGYDLEAVARSSW